MEISVGVTLPGNGLARIFNSVLALALAASVVMIFW
jgi:hypothetical protein